MNTPAPIFRQTIQRQIILKELAKLTNPTATEVFDVVRKLVPKISLATVYRNLEIMADMGMVRKIEVGGTRKRFDAITKKHHYHIRCSSCGKIDDLDVEIYDDLVKEAAKNCLYQIQGHRVEFSGVCPDCQQI